MELCRADGSALSSVELPQHHHPASAANQQAHSRNGCPPTRDAVPISSSNNPAEIPDFATKPLSVLLAKIALSWQYSNRKLLYKGRLTGSLIRERVADQDGVVALGAGREHRHRRADQLLDPPDVFDRDRRQIGPGAGAAGASGPAFRAFQAQL